MMGKYKKSKNPSEIDSWLETIGYYRKNVAYDETCLFRAVSEQMFYSQIFHEKVRMECIEYAKKNFDEFRMFVSSEAEWKEHLDKLATHMVVCGYIEIQIISRKYKRDVILFDGILFNKENITNNNFADSLCLCLVTKDHYDVVYKQEHILTAGFCQSIVYSVLYERVLDIQNVTQIVHTMLYEKPTIFLNGTEFINDQNKVDHEKKIDMCATLTEGLKVAKLRDNGCTKDCCLLEQSVVAPFPYKVAKALDPNIYRNIEFDTWTEIRREMRIGDWYYGDNNLILGTSCILSTDNGKLNCYIQEIIKEENKCVVYITSLAEKRTVNYSDLSPEDDAKPWPLPYRFSKNLVLSPPCMNLQLERKSVRKRKDKKLFKNLNLSNTGTRSPNCADADTECGIAVYEGCPLQMKASAEDTYAVQNPVEEERQPIQEVPVASAPPYVWEQQWQKVTPEPAVWHDTPTINNMYQPPDIIPYQDANVPSPYIYGYPTSPFNCNMWPNAEYMMSPSGQSPNIYSEGESQQTNTPITPTSPYFPVFSVPPATPIIYTTTDMPDLVLQSPHIPVYSPTVNMQYIPPPPYLYPTTPPAAWYPPGVNSQGFIFPAPPVNIPSSLSSI